MYSSGILNCKRLQLLKEQAGHRSLHTKEEQIIDHIIWNQVVNNEYAAISRLWTLEVAISCFLWLHTSWKISGFFLLLLLLVFFVVFFCCLFFNEMTVVPCNYVHTHFLADGQGICAVLNLLQNFNRFTWWICSLSFTLAY